MSDPLKVVRVLIIASAAVAVVGIASAAFSQTATLADRYAQAVEYHGGCVPGSLVRNGFHAAAVEVDWTKRPAGVERGDYVTVSDPVMTITLGRVPSPSGTCYEPLPVEDGE